MGTNANPYTWKVPYDEKTMKLAPFSLEKVRTRTIIDSLELQAGYLWEKLNAFYYLDSKDTTVASVEIVVWI